MSPLLPIGQGGGVINRILVGVLLMLVAAGCAAGPADRGSVARVDTLASGRIEVTNTGISSWTPETAWRLEEDLRLGTSGEPRPDGSAVSGSDPELFGSIQSIASDSRGRIHAFDWIAQDVRVFHPDGAYSHTIGRRGAGPGEFSGAWAVTIGPGDTLTVLDDIAGRYAVFSPDGTFLKNHPRTILGYGASMRRAVLRDGSYVDWGPAYPDGRFGSRFVFYPIRHAPGFTRVDTFPPLVQVQEMVPSGRMPLLYFSERIVGAVDSEGAIWFANSRDYRIFRRTLEGDTTLVLTFPATAVPLGEEERDHVREAVSGGSPAMAEQLQALPASKPIIHQIMPDNAGQIYIFADLAEERAGTVVDVFKETGEYLGRLLLPMPIVLSPRGAPPITHATAEHLFVLVEDELGVPHISRLKIVKGRDPID